MNAPISAMNDIMSFCLQETESLQAKSMAQWQLQQQVHELHCEVTLNIVILTLFLFIQEQSSRRDINELKGELRSSEAVVAELQNTLQQRDLELDTVRSKVGPKIQHDNKINLHGAHTVTHGQACKT